MSQPQTAPQKARKSETPYSALPDHCFWSRAHRKESITEIDPVVKGHFLIEPDWKIATAGSCFAQHIARHLRSSGYNYFVPEAAHPVIDDEVAAEYNYGTFSARYGNIYTVRQLLQLAKRARGLFQPEENIWIQGESRIDPYRPNIQPNGFSRQDDFLADRERHFTAVRRILDESDLFVFTFGLTEGWVSLRDGAVFPLAPGVAGGSFDARKHAFVNFTVAEIVADFKAFVAMMRENNPSVKILMTVSPVPLMATARADQSVITATSYSKAVLRVACEELQASVENCFYFPSYEVISSNFSRGAYFAEDLREVQAAGVEHVMSLFMRHYTKNAGRVVQKKALGPRGNESLGFKAAVEKVLNVICDEELIEGKKR
jgi:hypothetical protein